MLELLGSLLYYLLLGMQWKKTTPSIATSQPFFLLILMQGQGPYTISLCFVQCPYTACANLN